MVAGRLRRAESERSHFPAISMPITLVLLCYKINSLKHLAERGYSGKGMGMPGSATTQSLEEVHGLVQTAVVQRRPIAAIYDGVQRLFCPHVLGYNESNQHRAFCYQYGGDSGSEPQPRAGIGIWRCMALEKLRSVELLDEPWQTEPHARQRCVKHVEVDAEDHPDRDPQNGH